MYEVRYVRGLDGAVLAKQSLEVVEEEVRIEAPPVAGPGTRFEVRVTGVPGPGDFVAVARTDAGLDDFLDFAFVDSQTTTSLAAPFEPGRYEVRYVSAAGPRIVAASPLTVR
jgi:Ca-activated chloride channel family protein